MRHIFAEKYSCLEGRHPDGLPRMVERLRCSRCGVGATWPGASGNCVAIPSNSEKVKPRSARSRSRGKATRGPDGRVYPSLAAMCEAHGQCPDIVRGVLRRIPTLTPAGAVLHCEREAAE